MVIALCCVIQEPFLVIGNQITKFIFCTDVTVQPSIMVSLDNSHRSVCTALTALRSIIGNKLKLKIYISPNIFYKSSFLL